VRVTGRVLLLGGTGEAGRDKTTLVGGLQRELAAAGRACCSARGRCSERLGGAEAFLPVLERCARVPWVLEAPLPPR